MSDLITVGLLATGLPVFIGMLMAYTVIALVLGVFLWSAKSVPESLGIAVASSGFIVGALLAAGVVIFRYTIA